MPALILFFLLLLLLPLLFGHILVTSLVKLNLTPDAALVLIFAILFGALINIPVRRIARHDEVHIQPFAIFGLPQRFPRFRRRLRETIIAVNVGGCLVPVGLAIYELFHIAAQGWAVVVATGIAAAVSITVCYFLARPVPGVGIAMPGLIPPLVAAACALILAPDFAPPVAFVAGVAGPVIGADLLHLREVARLGTGMASIGGAGTFDGIVLSGILAAWLA